MAKRTRTLQQAPRTGEVDPALLDHWYGPAEPRQKRNRQ